MEKSCRYSALIILLFFCLIVSIENGNSASQSDDKKWSFDFDNCSINDALQEISKKTGIDISIDKTMDKTLVSRSYVHRSIGEIIRDLLGNENYAIGIYPNHDSPESIQVWIVDNDGVGKAAVQERPTSKKRLKNAHMENKLDAFTENKPVGKQEESPFVLSKPVNKQEGIYAPSSRKISKGLPNGTTKSEDPGSGSTDSESMQIPPQQEVPLSPATPQNYAIESPPMPPGFH